MRLESGEPVSDTVFHTKYRPRTLEHLIGHEDAKTRLLGMIKNKSVPGAIMIVGPSSAGKTTLARALAASVNSVPIENQVGDYKEMDLGSARSIDDVRELIRISKLKPRLHKRVFVLDEAQSILSNRVAASALLKSLEEAGTTDTIWILCSMEPQKFKSDVGRAIANRCSQFVLSPHTDEDLYKQGVRIIKGERIEGLNKELLKTIVGAANNEMRTLANLLQAARDYAAGGGNLDEKSVQALVDSASETDDQLVLKAVKGLHDGSYKSVVAALLDVQDGFQFVNKMLWAAQFLVNSQCVGRHQKVWYSPLNKELANVTKGRRLGDIAEFLDTMVEVKVQVQQFAIPEIELLQTRLYRLIMKWHAK